MRYHYCKLSNPKERSQCLKKLCIGRSALLRRPYELVCFPTLYKYYQRGCSVVVYHQELVDSLAWETENKLGRKDAEINMAGRIELIQLDDH